MSRTRIVKGTYTKISQEGHSMYSNANIITNAGAAITETGVNNGVTYGDPKKPAAIEGDYIIDGEWLDQDGNPIDTSKTPHARIGNTVFFRVKTKNIPENTPLSFELWESDGISLKIGLGTVFDSRMFDDFVPLEGKESGSKAVTANIDKDGYAIFSIDLTEYFEQYIEEDAGAYIELYFIARYIGHDMAYLPRDNSKYLQVGYSDRTLFIQSAVGDEKYGLPEFRSADGDIIIFSGGVESIDKLASADNIKKEEDSTAFDRVKDKIKDEIEGKIKDKAEEMTGKGFDKLQKTIAVHQLKKGKLGMNNGQVRTNRRLYTTTQFDNLGEEYTVTRASNFGYVSNGERVTSKGISQLDFFKETNVYSKVAKVGKNALDCLAFLDLAKYISGNGELPSIPSPVPGLDFVIDIMVTETKEGIKEMWDEAVEAVLEKAKDLGVKGVKEFVLLNANSDKQYETIEASQDTLEKLLSGKIRKRDKLENLEIATQKQDGEVYRKAGNQPYKSSLNYIILLRQEYDEKIADDIFIIETIFIKN